MKKILMMSIALTFFVSCGHMYGHNHDSATHADCKCSDGGRKSGACATGKDVKADSKAECEDCKKGL